MKTAIITINEAGQVFAAKLEKELTNTTVFNLKQTGTKVKPVVKNLFKHYEGIIFIAACGIVVRSIAPFIKNKLEEPAVVCLDTAGRSSISLLSGHEGGANALAYRAAAITGAKPVITTGTQAHKKIIIGIGCRKGAKKQHIQKALEFVLAKREISRAKIRVVATIDIKCQEKGLLAACEAWNLPLVFFTKEEINHFAGEITSSTIAKKYVGVYGVCEPCALMAGRKTSLLHKKTIIDGVTVALAQEN